MESVNEQEDIHREDFFDDPNYESKIIWVNQILSVIPKFNSAVFDSPIEEMKGHLKPLLLTLMIEGQEVNKVLVNGGATVNILPKTMLKRFGKSLADLKPHNIMISDYAGKSSHPEGMILLDVQIESVKRATMFIVTPSKANFNVLLGREWIHGVGAVPSMVHQKIFFWNDDEGLEVLEADQKTYEVGMYFADQQLTAFTKTKPFDAYNSGVMDEEEGIKKTFCWDVKKGIEKNEEKEKIENQRDQGISIKKENQKTKGQVGQKIEISKEDKEQELELKLDCIFDDSPLGFERAANEEHKLESQDPLEEINLGTVKNRKVTYISKFLQGELKEEIIRVLHEYKDCFAWDYDEMPGLDRELVEHRLPMIPGKKPVKQSPRRFAPEIIEKIKGEIERLLKVKFIRTSRYPEWISNIVPVIKKNGKLRVCIDFRDLNMETPKDEYPMPIAETMIDAAAGAETRYTPLEKLCLSLYVACTKLKYYIRPCDVVIFCRSNVIKYMLCKPVLHSQVGKWALALTEYSLTFEPLKATKGQIIADFLADHSNETEEIIYLTTKPWQLYFDGSKHELGTGIGLLIISPEGSPTKLSFKTHKGYSNNETEYHALITGLEILKELDARNVSIQGDSQLVIKQLTQEYKCLNEKLIEFKTRAAQLLNAFDEVELQHIPRNSNTIANELAQIASGYKVSKEYLEYLIHTEDELTDHREILSVNSSSQQDWRSKLIEYLQNPNIKVERKIKLRALNYVLLNNELYKRGFDGILFKCLGSHESYIAMAEIHEGICGAHQAGEKMKWVLSRKGLYWPTMIKDCIEFAKSCKECQKHGPIQKVPARIRMITSTPYYAQENGQVEAANKVVIGLIKKYISNRPQSWHETLVQILWAYRNPPRDATKTTPYKLVYGHDAILPLDINLQSICVQKQNELPTEDYWNLMYDELISLDEERLIALQNLVQQKEKVERAYNKRVKTQCFRVGDLVLKVILPIEQKSRYLGKWSYNWEGPFIVEQVYSKNAYIIKEINSNICKVMNGKYLMCFHNRAE
uniref:Uncharacterized protein Mb2253c family n=1 Tax=Cajanus cajan TaxID=3821 RepID=A0A151R0U5_CAJCA|nr:Uncharacterized protein Mb2253c family [Cajanus cajan]